MTLGHRGARHSPAAPRAIINRSRLVHFFHYYHLLSLLFISGARKAVPPAAGGKLDRARLSGGQAAALSRLLEGRDLPLSSKESRMGGFQLQQPIRQKLLSKHQGGPYPNGVGKQEAARAQPPRRVPQLLPSRPGCPGCLFSSLLEALPTDRSARTSRPVLPDPLFKVPWY